MPSSVLMSWRMWCMSSNARGAPYDPDGKHGCMPSGADHHVHRGYGGWLQDLPVHEPECMPGSLWLSQQWL